MRGSKILITGPTGQVAKPIAKALAADNEVWGIARFTDAGAREGLEKSGVRCETVNLAAGDFSDPVGLRLRHQSRGGQERQMGQGPRGRTAEQ
jgi:nucleoside-diphosphate-sugar epimerase